MPKPGASKGILAGSQLTELNRQYSALSRNVDVQNSSNDIRLRTYYDQWLPPITSWLPHAPSARNSATAAQPTSRARPKPCNCSSCR